MKYTNMANKIGKVFLCIVSAFMILLILGIAGVFIWVDFYVLDEPAFSLFWFALLPFIGLGINWFLGSFFGDEYYNTGWVNKGKSVHDVKKTPKYYTRRMFLCFVECLLFALLIIRFALFWGIISILGIVGSIVGIIIYFIVGMSSYENSSIRNKKMAKDKTEEPKVEKTEEPKMKKIVHKKPVHKFKFDNYPELLDKYNAFKHWNSKKYIVFENLEDKTRALNEKDKAFEILALAVFNTFNEIKPQLIIKKTGERVQWDEVINKPFEELSYIEKLILVRLLDKLYKYVLPNEYYNL